MEWVLVRDRESKLARNHQNKTLFDVTDASGVDNFTKEEARRLLRDYGFGVRTTIQDDTPQSAFFPCKSIQLQN